MSKILYYPMVLPKPKKIKPFNYQKKVIRQLAKKEVCILGAEMGTGKTIMALLAMEAHGYKRLLVVCPAIAVSHWYREHEKLCLQTEIRVVSFDKARQDKTHKELMEWGHEGLIIDEAHYLKSPNAKRTKAIYGEYCDGKSGGLVTGCKRVYALSGTICPNNVSELYPHLRFMKPSRVKGNAFSFLNRYCSTLQTRWGTQITGTRNKEELIKIMKDIYIPLRAKDVLPDLPAISFNDRVIDPIDAKEALLRLKEIEKLPEIELLVQQLENAAEVRSTPVSEHVATLRRLIGTAKSAAAVQYILEIIGSSKEKVVVFAYHKHVIRHITNLLVEKTKVAVITGDTSKKQRDEAIDKFRNTEDCRVFIGQLHACGTGITLTESNHVVFAEQDWTPATNLQAAKRCHRIGQDKPVWVHNLMLHNSIDERISAAISTKTQHLLEFGLCPT